MGDIRTPFSSLDSSFKLKVRKKLQFPIAFFIELKYIIDLHKTKITSTILFFIEFFIELKNPKIHMEAQRCLIDKAEKSKQKEKC